MEYIFRQGTNNKRTFVLLHGTGGNEKDLLPIGEALDLDANILAIRGNINENGMLRFFKRKAEGIYDLEDLSFRSTELVSFISDIAQQYKFVISSVIFVGFSNGANMALEILLKNYKEYTKAILFAPLYPMDFPANIDLSDHQIFLSMGEEDPICSKDENRKLIDKLENNEASIQTFWVHTHQITYEGIAAAKSWLETL